MSTDIYWFSGSGNSLYVAKRISDKLKNVRLLPISEFVGKPVEIPERLGLVFPVYAWGPPLIVARFIENLPRGGAEYVFAVATCGSSAGSTMTITEGLLKKRGISLSADFSVKMVENYPPMGGAPSVEKQGTKLREAEDVIEEIALAVARGDTGSHGGRSFFFNLIGRLVYPLFRKGVSRQTRVRFLADGACSSCGICTRVCPVGNITEQENGKPVWGTRCE